MHSARLPVQSRTTASIAPIRKVYPACNKVDAIPAPENNLLQNVSEDAKTVYAVLNDTPKHASELELELGMPTGKILAALTELELFGLIKTYPGQRFTKA